MKIMKNLMLSIVSIFTALVVFAGYAPGQTKAANDYVFEFTGLSKTAEMSAYTGEIHIAGGAGSIKPAASIEVELPEFLSCNINANTFNTTNTDFVKLKSITGTTTKKVVFTIDTNVTENGAFDAKIPFAITVCDLPTLNKGDADISQTISTKLISEGKVIETKTKEFKVSPTTFNTTRKPIHKWTEGSLAEPDEKDKNLLTKTFSSFSVPVRNDLTVNFNSANTKILKPLENVVVTDTLGQGQTLADVPASVNAPNKDKKVLLLKKDSTGKYSYVTNYEVTTSATGFSLKILNDTAEENEYVVRYWVNQTTLKKEYRNVAKVEATNLNALINQYQTGKDGTSTTVIKPAPNTSGGAEIRKTVDKTLVEANDANQKVNYTINMEAKLAYENGTVILEDTINSDVKIDSIEFDKTKLKLDQTGNTIKFTATSPISAGEKFVFTIKTDFAKVVSGKTIPNTARYLGLFNTNTVNTVKLAPEFMKIQGTTFEDVNKNGAIDAGETKLANVEVKLYEVDSNSATPTRTLIKTVKTDANGLYDFGQVRSFFASENKKYVVERSDVAGYTFFSGNGPDFKFDAKTKFSTDVKSVANTTQVGNIGYIKDALSKIGDTVFEDTNRNGIQDAGEKGIANVSVTLYETGKLVKTVKTDASGKYLFDKLPAGNYNLKVGRPAGMTETTNLLVINNVDTRRFKLDGSNERLDLDFGFDKTINDPLTNTSEIENKNKNDDSVVEKPKNPELPIIVK